MVVIVVGCEANRGDVDSGDDDDHDDDDDDEDDDDDDDDDDFVVVFCCCTLQRGVQRLRQYDLHDARVSQFQHFIKVFLHTV